MLFLCCAGGQFPLLVNTSALSGEQTIVITAVDPSDGAGGRTTITVSVPGKFESDGLLWGVSLCRLCCVQLNPLSLPHSLHSTWSASPRSCQGLTK